MGLSASFKRLALDGFAIVALCAGLTLSPAQAANWGHLRGPFSYESQVRAWLDVAAEKRAERGSERQPASVDAQFLVRYGRPPVCTGVPQHCAF